MHVQIIIVPYDTARRGWRSGAGPEHLLRAGLPARLQGGGHPIAQVEVIEADAAQPPAEIATGFELMRKVAVAVRTARAAGRFPLVLSGNCNASVGALSGLTPSRRALFWFDAHGDLNTPDTTTSGFLDGTGLATALGLCWHRLVHSIPGFQPVAPETTFLLGARDLDPPEQALLAEEPVTVIAARGLDVELPAVLNRAPIAGAVGHVHLDLDVLDPVHVGRANALPVPDGLSVEQLTGAIAAIRTRVPLAGATLASMRRSSTRRAACAVPPSLPSMRC
jgi:arginase